MLKELKKNKMSVVATGILFGVMGVLIIPMIAVIVKISNALSKKHPRKSAVRHLKTAVHLIWLYQEMGWKRSVQMHLQAVIL